MLKAIFWLVAGFMPVVVLADESRDESTRQVVVEVVRQPDQPLEAVSVVVSRMPDMAILGAGVTNQDGRITLSEVPCTADGEYRLRILISQSEGTRRPMPEAVRQAYWHTAVRSPVFQVLPPGKADVSLKIQFEPARVIRGSVSVLGGQQQIRRIECRVADQPNALFGATPDFFVPHVKFAATTLFYGSSKLVSISIPAGTDDIDLGVLQFTPETAGCEVVGEVDVDPSLNDMVEFAMESGISFVRRSDSAIFTFDNATTSAGRGPERRRVWPIGDSSSSDPSLSLPPGQYVVVPGRFRAHDFQCRAVERVRAGEVFEAPAIVFTAVAGERSSIGRIDYKQLIEYFIATPPDPAAP
jgi:hypothetical protein